MRHIIATKMPRACGETEPKDSCICGRTDVHAENEDVLVVPKAVKVDPNSMKRS